MAIEELDWSAFPEAKRLDKVAEATAAGRVVNAGWVPPGKRTAEQQKTHERLVGEMPRFGIRGGYRLESRRYPLWKAVRSLLGKDPQWVWQQTGSCVGASTGSAVMVAQGVEIKVNGDREEYRHPWWLYTYGRGRFHGGMRGKGEGSFGSAQAKAITTDGMFELDPEGEPDLPDPTIRSGWSVHPSGTEMDWSDGGRIAANWLKVGKTRLFQTAAPIRSADDMIAALANGYVCFTASMFGFSPMVPPVEGKGENQVRLVRRWNGSWSHQMFDVEFWDHPDLGPIFGKGNQWGPTAHNPGGETPSGYPNCMYYVTYELQDKILKHSDTEAFALSGYDGFPAREPELDWSAF